MTVGGKPFFTVNAVDPGGVARQGCLHTAHGTIETPCFMPVGTRASVKAVSPAELTDMGIGMILANTYHCLTRPGVEIIAAAGGLHRFMGWPGAILTDSGGYQVFSLAKLRRIDSTGVVFQSHVDGSRIQLGPREAMAAQRQLGSDIAMAFDECPPWPCSAENACEAVDHTLLWAVECIEQPRADGQHVFGIVQGGSYQDLRERCARELTAMEFDGYAIGGVSVGEPADRLLEQVRHGARLLPVDRPRYLMGVGDRRQILEAVAQGIDMFDCVMPTRLARNGTAFTEDGRYPVKAGEYKADSRPIEEGCACYACRHFSRAYVRHLLNVGEILGVRLVTLHNLYRYMRFMAQMRDALRQGRFHEYRREYLARVKEI